MNWAALACGTSLISAAATIIVAVYIYGKLTQKVTDHDDNLKEHDRRLDGHSVRIGASEVAIGKLEAWREGYNSAARRLPSIEA